MRTCFSKLMSGDSPYTQLIKKFAHGSTCRVTTDLSEVYDELKENFGRWGLSEEALQYYKDVPIHCQAEWVEAADGKALQKRVW